MPLDVDRWTLSVVPLVALVACAGSPTPAPATTPSSAYTTGSPAATVNPAPPLPTLPTHSDADDPNESATPIAMTVDIDRSLPKSAFPKRTVDDRECWSSVSLSGDAKRDFDQIAARCGAPTGLLEYAKPVSGHLHAKTDKRDTFTLKLAKGYCYRYFAVADSTITDLDILVEKPDGALVADDKQTSPVAIIQADKTWCMDDDAEYDFHIEVDGTGAGKYVFGVWARPQGGRA